MPFIATDSIGKVSSCYYLCMNASSLFHRARYGVPPGGSGPFGWLADTWRALHFSALLLVMAASPATYTAENRRRLASHICLTCSQTVPAFTLLSALLSLVLVHIVVVTAQSYGLSQFALGTVVRVLVVELLPLSAALFVALRAGTAINTEITALRQAASSAPRPLDEATMIHRIILPRVAGSAVAVILLVTISGGLALLLAYFGVYGFTPWGVANFTRTVGQVFEPVVLMALGLKTLLFAIAVASIPASAGLLRQRKNEDASLAVLRGTVRLFAVLIGIEILSLTVEFI
ncbi:MAG: ABC transporter permease [Betaproteobacteria bacterium HGW-Betaproteobacteria-10]|jgi:phospholipid/cholesterol/gamma-HCH transport system permease protein|nr:MAG: ABC transporter permease [Betaproteobacteria bacterium HGW-Betaproteobacteria-10]